MNPIKVHIVDIQEEVAVVTASGTRWVRVCAYLFDDSGEYEAVKYFDPIEWQTIKQRRWFLE